MSNFPQEGWICLHPYDKEHFVAKIPKEPLPNGRLRFEWGALCDAYGWMNGPGLRESQFVNSDIPACKKCEKLLASLLETRKEDQNGNDP